MAFIDDIKNIQPQKENVSKEEIERKMHAQVETAAHQYIEHMLECAKKQIKDGGFEQHKGFFTGKITNKMVLKWAGPGISWYMKRNGKENCVSVDFSNQGDDSPFINIVCENGLYYYEFISLVTTLAMKEGFHVETRKMRYEYKEYSTGTWPRERVYFTFTIEWKED